MIDKKIKDDSPKAREIRKIARSRLEALMPGLGRTSLDAVVDSFENNRSSNTVRYQLEDAAFDFQNVMTAFQRLYESDQNVQEHLLSQARENGINEKAADCYARKCGSERLKYEDFKDSFPEEREFYKFAEVMEHLAVMSFRHYLGFRMPELTHEGERLKPLLSVYSKGYANDYAELLLESESPEDYIRKGKKAGLIAFADFFESVGAEFSRAYKSDHEFKEYVEERVPSRWKKPKLNVFFDHPRCMPFFITEDCGIKQEEVDDFRRDIGQFMLDTMKLYVRGD